MFAIEVSEIGDVVVLGLGGELDDLPGGQELLGAVDAKLAEGRRKFLINFEKLQRINSSGVGFIIVAHSRIRKASGRAKLCGMQPRISRVWVVTHLKSPFDIFESCQDALAQFRDPD